MWNYHGFLCHFIYVALIHNNSYLGRFTLPRESQRLPEQTCGHNGKWKKSSFLTEGNRSRLWKQGHLPRLVGVRGKWREKRGLLKLTSFILSLWLFMCIPECHTMNGFGVRKSESTQQYAHLYYSLHLVYDGRLFALHMWHSGTDFSL